ncbi:MAG: alpha/beta hydrolase [Chloroflexota bacterium]|nr:alpha/beta hydrolase [Chloroflexota bacterium]
MATRGTTLIIPGWQNSGPEHWQSRWQREHPDYRRVEQRNWDVPDRAQWVATLESAVAGAPAPVTLVAHSLGCALVAHWAALATPARAKVTGALLVAPPDVERADMPPEVLGFRPLPLAPLPFRSKLVASDDDPYCALDAARGLAARWGCQFVALSGAGHLNTDAGYGPWPAGEALLAALR